MEFHNIAKPLGTLNDGMVDRKNVTECALIFKIFVISFDFQVSYW